MTFNTTGPKYFFALNINILYSDEIATDIPRVSLIETMQRGLFIFPYSLSHNGSVFTAWLGWIQSYKY